MVIDFLVNDDRFPRAIRACIEFAKQSAGPLPRAMHLVHSLEKAEHALPSPLPEDLDGADVSELMDTLQQRLGDAHTAVVETWFLPGDDE